MAGGTEPASVVHSPFAPQGVLHTTHRTGAGEQNTPSETRGRALNRTRSTEQACGAGRARRPSGRETRKRLNGTAGSSALPDTPPHEQATSHASAPSVALETSSARRDAAAGARGAGAPGIARGGAVGLAQLGVRGRSPAGQNISWRVHSNRPSNLASDAPLLQARSPPSPPMVWLTTCFVSPRAARWVAYLTTPTRVLPPRAGSTRCNTAQWPSPLQPHFLQRACQKAQDEMRSLCCSCSPERPLELARLAAPSLWSGSSPKRCAAPTRTRWHV